MKGDRVWAGLGPAYALPRGESQYHLVIGVQLHRCRLLSDVKVNVSESLTSTFGQSLILWCAKVAEPVDFLYVFVVFSVFTLLQSLKGHQLFIKEHRS